MTSGRAVRCRVKGCGRVLTLQGLNGHLRLTHGMSREKAAAISARLRQAEPKPSGRETMGTHEAVLFDVARLQEIRERILNANDGGYGVSAANVVGALRQAEGDIRDRLCLYLQQGGSDG
jgi:hypothetical protein